MATNIVFKNPNEQSLPVPAGTKSGDPVRVGSLNGIAVTDRAATTVPAFNADGTPNTNYNKGGGNPNGNATVWLAVAPELLVKGAEIAVGDPIHFDANATPKLTATPGSLPLFGHALSAGVDADSGNQTVIVRIAN